MDFFVNKIHISAWKVLYYNVPANVYPWPKFITVPVTVSGADLSVSIRDWGLTYI